LTDVKRKYKSFKFDSLKNINAQATGVEIDPNALAVNERGSFQAKLAKIKVDNYRIGTHNLAYRELYTIIRVLGSDVETRFLNDDEKA